VPGTIVQTAALAAGSLTDVSAAWPGWSEIVRTLTLRAGFNTTLVVVGTTMLGLAAGVIGVFALLRKRSLVADALSHATLPGIGLAFLGATALGLDGRSLPILLVGAAVTGVAGVACIQGLLRFTRLREDAAIGIVLSVFFGAGVVALSVIQNESSANAAGLESLIYGQTAAMSMDDAVLLGAIAVVAVLAAALLEKEFATVCFNDAFARASGWPVTLIDALMMALVVLVTVAGLQAVGLILVVALLIVPPVTARLWTSRLTSLVVLSAVVGGLSGYLGSVVSALLPRKPAGSVIVLVAGAIFALSLLLAPSRGVVAASVRRLTLRLRIACEHVLEAAFERAEDGGPARLEAEELRRLARLRAWPAWLRPLIRRSLRHRGLVGFEDGAAVLTEAGRSEGARVRRNHRLWEQYLVSHADVAPSHVDWSVDQVEHVLTPELIASLERSLEQAGVAVPPPPAEPSGDAGARSAVTGVAR